MKRVLSSLGIGSATVDTILPHSTVHPGDSLDVRVEVEGGSTDQEVDDVYFAVVTRYVTEEGDETAVVARSRLTESFTIGADEEREFAATVEIPRHTPLTLGRTEVWIETGLDIDWAVDPDDEDRIEVEADERLAAVFEALDQLGFTFHTADCTAAPRSLRHAGTSFTQEFEFRAAAGPFAGDLDELEVIPQYTDDGLVLALEVDRRGGLLAEMADADERHTRVPVDDTDPDCIAADLQDAIERQL
jgi:sporulation-control protein